MQFGLSTLFLLFVVLWSSLAAFGGWGIAVFVAAVGLAVYTYRTGQLWPAVFVVILLLLIGLFLLPAVEAAREADRRFACPKNMTMISLALHNYRQANGCFPPAYVVDKDGRPMHSWRVLILPYLDRKDLYKQYKFDESWDGPNNKKLLATRPSVYACPDDKDALAQDVTMTSYAAVVGVNAAWPGEKPGKLIGDLSQTIMLVEVANAGIKWTEPRDLSLDALQTVSPKTSVVTAFSKHGCYHTFFYDHESCAGVNVAMADGSGCFLGCGCLVREVLRDMLRIGGCTEEAVEGSYSLPPTVTVHINRSNCIAFAVWLASVGWLLDRAERSRKKASIPDGEKAQEANTAAESQHPTKGSEPPCNSV
jgi:hypothetical protein